MGKNVTKTLWLQYFVPFHALLAMLSQVFYNHSSDHVHYFFPRMSTKSGSEIHHR